MAQSVKHMILGFSSGHDLTTHECQGHVGFCAGSGEPVWDSLSPFLFASVSLVLSPSLSLSLSLSVSLSKVKKQKILKKIRWIEGWIEG